MLREKPLPQKPKPGDLVVDRMGREYIVQTIGTKLVYVKDSAGRISMFGVRDVTLRPDVSEVKAKPMSLDEEFLGQ